MAWFLRFRSLAATCWWASTSKSIIGIENIKIRIEAAIDNIKMDIEAEIEKMDISKIKHSHTSIDIELHHMNITTSTAARYSQLTNGSGQTSRIKSNWVGQG